MVLEATCQKCGEQFDRANGLFVREKDALIQACPSCTPNDAADRIEEELGLLAQP